jgi:RNA polymerase sigma factor (sigma-70 family)
VRDLIRCAQRRLSGRCGTGAGAAAVDELLLRYHPLIAGCLRSVSGMCRGLGGLDEGDLFQEARLAFLRAVARFDPGRVGDPTDARVSACLAAFAKRRVEGRIRVVLRRESRRRTEHTDMEDPQAPPVWERSEVMAALSRLPERQRLAIELTILHGLTLREAAVRLGLPGSTAGADRVRKLRSRGLASLRRALA